MRNLYGTRGINYIPKHSIFVIACLVLLSILLISGGTEGFFVDIFGVLPSQQM